MLVAGVFVVRVEKVFVNHPGRIGFSGGVDRVTFIKELAARSGPIPELLWLRGSEKFFFAGFC